jgi:hypothetical protein
MTIPQTTDAVSTHFDAMHKQYEDSVFSLINSIFEEHIKPACKKHHFAFFTGNGEFSFVDINKSVGYDLSEVPAALELSKDVKNMMLMYMERYGFSSNNLGSMMPSYDPDEDVEVVYVQSY